MAPPPPSSTSVVAELGPEPDAVTDDCDDAGARPSLPMVMARGVGKGPETARRHLSPFRGQPIEQQVEAFLEGAVPIAVEQQAGAVDAGIALGEFGKTALRRGEIIG